MATKKDKYYTKMLETLVDYNDHNNVPFSNEKIWQSFRRVMAEMEEEERYNERNANNVNIGTFFRQPPIKNDKQEEIANMTSERRISLDILSEMMYGFNELKIQ